MKKIVIFSVCMMLSLQVQTSFFKTKYLLAGLYGISAVPAFSLGAFLKAKGDISYLDLKTSPDLVHLAGTDDCVNIDNLLKSAVDDVNDFGKLSDILSAIPIVGNILLPPVFYLFLATLRSTKKKVDAEIALQNARWIKKHFTENPAQPIIGGAPMAANPAPAIMSGAQMAAMGWGQVAQALVATMPHFLERNWSFYVLNSNAAGYDASRVDRQWLAASTIFYVAILGGTYCAYQAGSFGALKKYIQSKF